ncbi:GAF domain-containing sensor histidine kinase [Christiangramia sabulilitoris]|uniref:histidine kinase n=1 Tax=Christiangramia sabulilitoris TaxID=2583991 RepID=A0A550I6L2_9FLAO|nr:GAF domain-containing sensor histidine kinase [Christiangramia sabulilitoris]TRO66603.1 GAF domain-containing sensor histidine kinase [Christiangramia sabulilitoris]
MISPETPKNEIERLKSLRQLNIMNSLPEQAYDTITELASYICKTPIAVVNMVDEEENWFKSKYGTDLTGSPRDVSFCGHTILNPDRILEVPDTTVDERFKGNPFVTGENAIKYYAGVPLLDTQGLPLGTLCVYDSKVHQLDEKQRTALKSLGKQVEMLLESRRQNYLLEQMKIELNENNRILREFASTVSHDLKMPLANMILTADILKVKYSNILDKEGMDYISYLKQSGLTLSDYINGLLDHYSNNKAETGNVEEFFLNDLLEDIIDLLQIAENCEINLPDNNLKIFGNSAAIGQIFMNLISNSLKYNSREKIIIEIDCTENREFFNFKISDNGIGIPLEKQEKIFDLFTTVAEKDRQGKKGHGIGLSTVKKIVESLGGTIQISSIENEGTVFEFSIKRNEIID